MITIVQQNDKYYEKLSEISTANKLCYAMKHKHVFLNYKQELTADPWYWHNTLGILKAMHDSRTLGDWIFWTDVDSLIMNQNFNVEELTYNVNPDVQIIASMWILPSESNIVIDGHNIKIIRDTCNPDLTTTLKDKDGNRLAAEDLLKYKQYQIHTGNFLIRRSTLAVRLLERIYHDIRFKERPEIIIPGSGDESAYAIYYNNYPNLKKYFSLLHQDIFCTVPKESKQYLNKFNMNRFTPIKEYAEGDFIMHVIGRWDDLTDIADWKLSVLSKWI